MTTRIIAALVLAASLAGCCSTPAREERRPAPMLAASLYDPLLNRRWEVEVRKPSDWDHADDRVREEWAAEAIGVGRNRWGHRVTGVRVVDDQRRTVWARDVAAVRMSNPPAAE